MTERRNNKCPRCCGDGYYWRVPDGFNPFLAGGFQTAAVSEKVRCWVCCGTGIKEPKPDSHGESGAKEK